MKRLLDIGRTGGFPLCAETLGALNENSEMLAEWLKCIPLKNRQAVQFGEFLLVCQGSQRRVVRKGAVSATSLSQSKLVFNTVTHSVYDTSGNEIADVWTEETADIVTETTPGAQWTLLELADVFELNLLYDQLPTFEAGLPAGLSVGITPINGSGVNTGMINSITLYGDGNEMAGNNGRVRMKVALRYRGKSTAQHVIQLPLPFQCPDGVRMEADVEDLATGAHYPIGVYTANDTMMVCVGRWLRDEGLIPSGSLYKVCDAVIRINKEVLL